jgi:hypoxanthine phosphoribosyltransferase
MQNAEAHGQALWQGQQAALSDLLEPLMDAAALAERVAALGRQITQDYATAAREGLLVVGVLKGAFPFFADLVRHIDLPLDCEFLRLSSYGDAQETSGEVKTSLDVTAEVAGQHVLLVEDIVDSGLSMQHLQRAMAARGAKSVSVCTLLHKPSGQRVEVPLRYVGFRIPPAFVVGYGLDYRGKLRNLPYVGVVRDGAEPALEQLLQGSPRATH